MEILCFVIILLLIIDIALKIKEQYNIEITPKNQRVQRVHIHRVANNQRVSRESFRRRPFGL